MISCIVAMDQNRVIGVENQLPWRLPEDLKHFKKTTQHHAVIMGRKTYDSIGKPLPNRRNIVLSRQAGLEIAGCDVCQTIEQALKLCTGDTEVFVIGGEQIYKLAMPYAKRLYVTQVHTKVAKGDAHFPEISAREWKKVSEEDRSADEKHAFAYSFLVFERHL